MVAEIVVPTLPHGTVTPVQPLIGAEISGIDVANASKEECALIHKAVLKYKAVFFHDQVMTRAQHVGFGKQFGELEVHPLSAHPEYPEMLVLKSVGEVKKG